MGPMLEALTEKAVEIVKDISNRLELPDDSGEKKYSSELPDDSGKSLPDYLSASVEPEAVEPTRELSTAEKAVIKAETGWSDEVINAISSMKEYEVYKQAEVVEAEICGKKCLIKSDIDMTQRDEFGRTNSERMAEGKPPITKSGETVELHHIGQKPDSPLAELTTQEHRGRGNDTVLHNKQKESEIDRTAFSKERELHWEARANNDLK